MSLGVVVKGPEGIVLATDTRITLNAQGPEMPSPLLVNFDNATKLLTFGSPHTSIAAVTYGEATVGLRTAHSFIPELEPTLGVKRLKVREYAEKLSDFFLERWKDAKLPVKTPLNGGMNFIVGGYDENAHYGEVFLFNVPNAPKPEPRNEGTQFGMTWGGQLEIASRLIHGYDPRLLELIQTQLKVPRKQVEKLSLSIGPDLEYKIPYDVLPLQDCVDLAAFLIRTTITAQNFAIAVRGVGGSIEVAAITRTEGLRWIQKKDLRGEG